MKELEKDIESYLNKQIKSLGGLSMKFVSPGKSGVPDRIILYNNHCYFVELKKPNEKPRALQIKIHEQFLEQGFTVKVIDTKDGVDDFVKEITDQNPKTK